ncbi:hypothetical protein N657DRAFT_644687 [Parathielavia appendiculata]|uniref:Integral membrane protein n=1 Tax=Parathielavia appendiculata TaxID=2587402 RepID=A0AAN6U3H9_9PEZI|nr:hypothetical protein N657DRAFT_644687 [Parathielavia appendiculata]
MARRRRPPRSGALAELPPLKILSQIAALQGLYYASALVLMLFTALVVGIRFSLDLVFGWDTVRGDTTQGWLMGFIWILDGGLLMAVAIVVLIGRSKLVLDFALSLHAIHLVVVTLYSGQLPRHTAWWFSMALASAVAVAMGTWGCRYRQLQPISFGGGGTASMAGGSGGENGGDTGEGGIDGDEEQGFSRGRGRGRGRDGAGEYEMANMDSEAPR